MSYTLEVPDAIYAKLQCMADASGTTPLGWIAAQLQSTDSPANSSPPDAAPREGRTLADRFAGRIGTFASSGDGRLSENCGEAFADGLAEKRRAGTL